MSGFDGGDGGAAFRMEQRLAFGITSQNAHAKLTGLPEPKRAVREALANLEEHQPDEAALLQEHLDCGKSTDPRWR